MRFYSTRNPSLQATLRDSVLRGMAPDGGLYMPDRIPKLPSSFFTSSATLSLSAIAFEVANALLGEDLPAQELKQIVEKSTAFDAPLVEVEEDVYALELFHGPTLAFKDFGARFMSQLLAYYAKNSDEKITVLVATSGDTGSAVANGFLNAPGIEVVVLYPSGKVSRLQEMQFTTLGGNVHPLEIAGTFDDCQRLVKEAFADKDLRRRMVLSSANSINVARLIPQTFYYFYAYSRIPQKDHLVFSVPSGNFGNLTAGLMAAKMGLPVHRFVAATNVNDIVPEYLRSNLFKPKPSVQTISNAMDVGNPSNFERMMDFFGKNDKQLRSSVVGFSFSDEETRKAMTNVFNTRGYVMDPHGAVGYLGLKKYLDIDKLAGTGIFLETAHPAKFGDVVESATGKPVDLPEQLQRFMHGQKVSTLMNNSYNDFRSFLTTVA